MRSGTPLGRYHYENRLFGGDDIIITRWGEDTLYGYEGNDHLIASGGDDVLFGGTGSDESHNAILTSFVTVESEGDEYDKWRFTILGAERQSAGESERTHTMKKGTNENTSGKKVRFFRPKFKRE